MKKWMIGTAALLLVLLMTTLAYAIVAENGSKDDPLISKSYLDSLEPKFISDIEGALKTKTDGYKTELDNKYKQISKSIDDQVAKLLQDSDIDINDPALIDAVASAVMSKMDTNQGNTAGGDTGNGVYRRVDLTSGQTAKCAIGTEIILRLGSAVATGSSNPAMVDISDSSSLNSGASLKSNHLYFVTIKDNGFKAGSNGCTVFIRGTYTVG